MATFLNIEISLLCRIWDFNNMVQGGSVLISQNAFATLALSSLNGSGTVFLRTGCAMTITQKAVKTQTAPSRASNEVSAGQGPRCPGWRWRCRHGDPTLKTPLLTEETSKCGTVHNLLRVRVIPEAISSGKGSDWPRTTRPQDFSRNWESQAKHDGLWHDDRRDLKQQTQRRTSWGFRTPKSPTLPLSCYKYLRVIRW